MILVQFENGRKFDNKISLQDFDAKEKYLHPISKSAGKMCRFRVNWRPIRHIFHHFQNMPASCERSLKGDLKRKFLLMQVNSSFE